MYFIQLFLMDVYEGKYTFLAIYLGLKYSHYSKKKLAHVVITIYYFIIAEY